MDGRTHVSAVHLKSGFQRLSLAGRARRTAPALVSDFGDDHEMSQEFGESVTRAGDRVAGFVFGAGLLALAWAAWLLL